MKRAEKVEQVDSDCPHCNNKAIICCPHCCGKGFFNWHTAFLGWISLNRCRICKGKGIILCPYCQVVQQDLYPYGS